MTRAELQKMVEASYEIAHDAYTTQVVIKKNQPEGKMVSDACSIILKRALAEFDLNEANREVQKALLKNVS